MVTLVLFAVVVLVQFQYPKSALHCSTHSAVVAELRKNVITDETKSDKESTEVIYHRNGSLDMSEICKRYELYKKHRVRTKKLPPNITPEFTFVHPPKIGSSFIMLLRNYLPACKIKNFTCFGSKGGGLNRQQ